MCPWSLTVLPCMLSCVHCLFNTLWPPELSTAPRIPGGFLVVLVPYQDSWWIPGTFLVPSCQDSLCILVHSWCIPGIFLVHSWCIPGTFYQDSSIRTILAVLSYFNSFGCYGD